MILQNRSSRNSKQKDCEVFKEYQKGFFCDQLANFGGSRKFFSQSSETHLKKFYSDIFRLLETKKGGLIIPRSSLRYNNNICRILGIYGLGQD